MPDIEIVVQWKANCSLCGLWQRFGRAGRHKEKTATAIFFVEKKHLDKEREKSAKRAEKSKETAAKRKAEKQLGPPTKRTTSSSRSQPNTSPAPTPLNTAVDGHRPVTPCPSDSRPVPSGSNIEQQPNTAHAAPMDLSQAPRTNSELTRIENEKRRLLYHEQEKEQKLVTHQRVVTTKRGTLTINGPLDDLINAGTREGLGCRRKVLDIYFVNDKISK